MVILPVRQNKTAIFQAQFFILATWAIRSTGCMRNKNFFKFKEEN